MIICSLIAGECMPPFKLPEQHRTMYDCLHKGYIESKSKLEEIGRTDVNQYEMYITLFDIVLGRGELTTKNEQPTH